MAQTPPNTSPMISKRTGTFESFDGTSIYYEVRGEGRPIFLCYGIGCLMNHWTHQLRYFSQDYQTIVFDYRGHHMSGVPTIRENMSIEAIARDIKGLMDHLGIERASLWGHSFGVQVLLRFFDLYPEAVTNLVFINGFAKNPIRGMFGVDAIAPLFNFVKDSYLKQPSIVTKIWKFATNNSLAIQLSSLAGGFNLALTNLKDIEVYARGVASMDLNVFITLFDDMMKFDGSPILDRIDKPTLIISGSKDGVTPQSFQDEMHERIERSEFLRVPYGSHCTQLDLPDFVNLRAEKFLIQTGYRPLPRSKEAPKGKRKAARPWRADL